MTEIEAAQKCAEIYTAMPASKKVLVVTKVAEGRWSASADKAMQAAFVKAVKHRLVDIGWSAKMLASEVGIYQSRWSEIANGKTSVSLEMVERVCQAVGLSVTFTPVEGGQP